MTPDTATFDFLAHCRPGLVLQTRDRRAARILEVTPESGLITGEVTMLGRCQWRADGRYHLAPAGAAGPWDLMPPADARTDDAAAAAAQPRESLAAALQSAEGNPGCCD